MKFQFQLVHQYLKIHFREKKANAIQNQIVHRDAQNPFAKSLSKMETILKKNNLQIQAIKPVLSDSTLSLRLNEIQLTIATPQCTTNDLKDMISNKLTCAADGDFNLQLVNSEGPFPQPPPYVGLR